MKITLINANTDLGVTVDGSNLGPKIISNHLKRNKVIDKIIDIEKPKVIKSKDSSDLEKNIEAVNEFNENLYKAMLEEKKGNKFPIILGGDHSLAIGSALGSIKQEKSLGILWIDAHLDYNTFETTITGNIHGLPLATINGLNKKLSMFHNESYYNPRNTVIIGYRAKEENKDMELSNIRNMGVTVFTTDDIKNVGVKDIMKIAFDLALKNTNGVHISYDLDVIDPESAPGVSIPEADGISEPDAYEIVDEILKYIDKIKSFDLVEFNPSKDLEHKTENIILNILSKLIKEKNKE